MLLIEAQQKIIQENEKENQQIFCLGKISIFILILLTFLTLVLPGAIFYKSLLNEESARMEFARFVIEKQELDEWNLKALSHLQKNAEKLTTHEIQHILKYYRSEFAEKVKLKIKDLISDTIQDLTDRGWRLRAEDLLNFVTDSPLNNVRALLL